MISNSLVLQSKSSVQISSNQSFKSISRERIAEIDLENLRDYFDNVENFEKSVKVIILKNCRSLQATVTQLELLRSSQVFVIVIRLKGTYDKSELGQLADKIAKPIVLQIDDYNSSRLFFVNADEHFEEVTFEDSHNVALSNYFDFNFFCNLLHSQPKKFGEFSFDFMKIKIDTNSCFKGKRLVDLAVEHGDLLTLKYLMLFQPDLDTFNDDKERILEITIENGNLMLLKAILEIPDDAETFESYLNPEKRNALNLTSNTDSSLLMLAAQSGKSDIIRFLLKCGSNVHFQNAAEKSAIDFAYENAHLNSVVELLEADSPFPCDYVWSDEPEGTKLDQLSRERDNLHDMIWKKKIDFVEKFIDGNPKIKCAYDERNQCALVTALQSENYEIYSFLRSKGFTHGIDTEHGTFLFELAIEKKDKLKLSNRKYFHSNENGHIMDLLSRSRLGFGSDQENFKKIQEYFEALDTVPEVRLILKVIALAKKLDIVFDFNQTSIADMDPTQNFKLTQVKGRTIYNNGNILIGARSNDADVLATMAHEFTHYAMHLLYNNHGLPYHAVDENQKQEFTEVLSYCEAMQAKNPVIENVFIYETDQYAIELIVRVPHLLALHHHEPDIIERVRKDFVKLFDFFTEKILTACEREIPLLTAKQKLRDLNKVLDVRKETEASKLFCDNTKLVIDEILNTSENILIRSSVPNLVMCNLLNSFKNSDKPNFDSMHIFIKLKQLVHKRYTDMIREAFESALEPKLFVLEADDDVEFSKIKDFYNTIKQSRVVSIIKSILVKKDDEVNFKKVFPIQRQIEYTWNDLNKTAQRKILASTVQFQGAEVSLSDVLTVNSEVLNEITLKEVFELSKIQLKTFNETVPPGPTIFIRRSFINTSIQTSVTLTSENFINLLVSQRSLILADDSGMGKTFSALYLARKLKQRNPHSWVVYIDLKQHTESYYKDENIPADDVTSDFFAEILKLNGRIEEKFFEHFYKNGKVIFILDGFDEISPVYTTCILEVVELIRKSNNLLLITTRTHLTKTLKENVPSIVMKHQQFSINDQVEFLIKYWSQRSKGLVCELEAKAQSLLGSLRESMTQEDFFGVPLQVLMLAEIYEKSNPTPEEIRELNVYSLYRSFIRKKTDIWIERGPLAKEDNSVIHTESSFNILQMHHKLAIESFFAKETTEALGLPEIEETLTDELLARIGLVQAAGSGKFLFTHQTFSEFLVADFVILNVAKRSLLVASEVLHGMFLGILNDPKFEKVRFFMNGKLEIEKKFSLEVLSVKLEKSFAVESNRLAFLNLVKENLSVLVTFLLTEVQISKSTKLSLVNQNTDHGECALHVAAKFNNTLNSYKQLWNCIESFSEQEEQKMLIFATGFHNRNVLNRAILNDKNKVAKVILDTAVNLMDPECFKKFMMQEDSFKSNALNVAARGHQKAFDILWEAIEYKLDEKDQKELLFIQELNKRNVLLNAVRFNSPEVIQKIMKITKKLFNYNEMHRFLFTEDFQRDTALHCAAFWNESKVFAIIWSFIKQVLNRDDQKILWLKRIDSNIFMRSIECPIFYQKTIAKEVIAAATEILDSEEIFQALSERNFRNATFISVATYNGLVDQIFDPEDFEWVAEENLRHQRSIPIRFDGNIEQNPIVRDLRDALRDDMSADELKLALYAEAAYEDTALQFALEFGSSFLADKIFQLVDMKFSRHERLKLIQLTSPTGLTILSRAEINGMSEVLDSVCNFLVRQSDLISDVNALLHTPDHYGLDFFTNAPMLSRKCLLTVLVWFKENLSHENFLKLFFERNITSKILAYEVVERCKEDLTRDFFKFCLSSIDPSEIKKMILIRFYDDHNMLGRSLFNPYSSVVREVWSFYVHTLSETDLEELLFKNNQGKIYFKKEEHKNPEAVEKFKAIVIKRFGIEKARKLIRIC